MDKIIRWAALSLIVPSDLGRRVPEWPSCSRGDRATIVFGSRNGHYTDGSCHFQRLALRGRCIAPVTDIRFQSDSRGQGRVPESVRHSLLAVRVFLRIHCESAGLARGLRSQYARQNDCGGGYSESPSFDLARQQLAGAAKGPDVSLGRSTNDLSAVSASTIVDPVSVAFDGKRLFVGDAALHRILIWNSLPASAIRNLPMWCWGSRISARRLQPKLLGRTASTGRPRWSQTEQTCSLPIA